ncbi:coiled-coil domain-containing protein [Paenibacillus sp. GCM10012307]|uniref:N-terminal domain of peptidoglycan hydrolase CwlO-containing protein n=1 Tax=Paenibacillus roseus TaxID=2798579 RepID=A0A934J9K6_9BACL|nr:hypothetical protein [Paenibacillus roseus]MBJ6363141.1 hypothetical protein [Paenibacillus roseus]
MTRTAWAPAALVALSLLVFFWTVQSLVMMPAFAQPADEQTRRLLEKSLSVVEIDKEIERVNLKKQELELQSEQKTQTIQVQEEMKIQRQADAGRVLRAYYTGERDILLGALLSFRKLSDFLVVMDYFEWIFARDRQVLGEYTAQLEQLQQQRQALDNQQLQLVEMEKRLLQQRARLAQLELEINRDLAASTDSERMRMLMEELSNYWQTVGLTEVKNYFRALSRAMKELPGWLKDNPEFLKMKGFDYTVRVPEDALNTFLRQQNELFKNFAFEFQKDNIQVNGQREGLSVAVSGHYTIENEPKNAIRFHVDELLFNGLALPDTTRKALEEEFDLSFYPQLIVKLIQAENVEILDKELVIHLKLKL